MRHVRTFDNWYDIGPKGEQGQKGTNPFYLPLAIAPQRGFIKSRSYDFFAKVCQHKKDKQWSTFGRLDVSEKDHTDANLNAFQKVFEGCDRNTRTWEEVLVPIRTTGSSHLNL